FVGRENLLGQLKREIEKGAATKGINQIVLYGMGGMGKTQLALEYAYRHCEDYSSVFWINAATEETMKIAGMFTVQQPREEQHIVSAVKEWFTAKQNTKWLLVFDNLDDLESCNINDYIPLSPHGTVIITSRRRESVHGRRWLEVEQMQNIEAEELLLKSAKLDFEKLTPDEAAVTIVQKLECLPLAIDQAGSYIHVRQYSFSRYLREYEANFTYLLSTEWKVGNPDRSVFAAWDLSFKAIQNQKPKAAELLLLCGLLNNDDICEELLQRGMNLPMDADTSLGDSIQALFSYSMVKRKDRDDSFSVHPLVHMWAQRKLELEPERYGKKAMEAFLMVASVANPKAGVSDVEHWIFRRRIFPHIVAVEKQMKYVLMAIATEDVQRAVRDLSKVYLDYGDYRKAEEMCKVALAGSEQLLGVDHPDTLATADNMAKVLQYQGQYDEALEWFEHALAGREKALGIDHPKTLTTVNNMATVYHDQGQYNRALEMHERALVGREKELGAGHPDTITTVNDMALIFHKQGQYTKALEWYERSLAGREKELGTGHPNTLTTVNDMALIFHKQGEYTKALEWYERAFAGSEKALGADHPDTLATVQNMALIFNNQGQYTKALEWYERVLAGEEKVLGTDHPDTLTTVHNMASVYHKQGQYTKALDMYERALAGFGNALGADHPYTLATVHNMASVYRKQGQYTNALELYKRALAGKEKALGADHPETLATVHNMASVFNKQRQYTQALELYERALVESEKTLGVDHPKTLTTVHKMASIFDKQCQYTKALELYERVLIGREKVLGADHSDTQTTVNDIARL
ncbi:hypothetical protein BDZ91DRAFT_632032, partial [Kalaharituber pfeilii]